VELTPSGVALELDFEDDGASGCLERFDDLPAMRFFGRAFWIARVIAQDFTIAVAMRELELEDACAVEAAKSPGGHSRQAEELAMKHGFACEPSCVAHLDDSLVRIEQQTAGRAYPLASEPGRGGRVPVLAHEVFELAEAHSARARQVARITKTVGRCAHARTEPFEESNVTVLAAVVKIGSTALARPKPSGLRLGLGRKKPDILGSRRASGAGR
jgi:hypothetical protein